MLLRLEIEILTFYAFPAFTKIFRQKERRIKAFLVADEPCDLFHFVCIHKSALKPDRVAAGGEKHVPASYKLFGATEEEMTKQGYFLYETFNRVAKNVVVKIPVNPSLEAGSARRYDGLKTIATLAGDGHQVQTTAPPLAAP